MGGGRPPDSAERERGSGPDGISAQGLPRDADSPPPTPTRALEFHPEPTLLLSPGGEVRYANRSACALFRLSPTEICDRLLLQFFCPENAKVIQQTLHGLSTDRPTSVPIRCEILRGGEGAALPARIVAAALDGDELGPGFALYLHPLERGEGDHPMGLRLFQAVEQVDELVVITDRLGCIEYVNPAFERITGWPRADALGKTPRILKSGRHSEEFYRSMWTTLSAGGSFHGVLLNRRRDGGLYYEEKTITPVKDDAGAVARFVATGRDVTQNTLAQQNARTSQERNALSLRGANDGVWDWDIDRGEVFLSGRWRSMLGYPFEEADEPEANWFGLVHPDDLLAFKKAIQEHLDGRTDHLESEHRMLHMMGNLCWVLVRGQAVRNLAGEARRMVGSQTDITERKVAEERLQRGALHDALTGLPNRALFIDRLRTAVTRARRTEGQRFAIMFMDLDRFKIINDGLGHLAGDQLLADVARRIRNCLRSSDTVARLGGDEFAVLLEDVGTESESLVFADRILAQFTAPYSLEGREVFTSVSIGIALFRPERPDPSDMVRDADTAMYYAKSHGRSRSAVFDDAMHNRAMYILELETDLRQALEASKLAVHYQPIVSLDTGRVAGFEALARWLHSKRGYIGPSEFIPVAEECGLIHPVGKFVLREACRHLKNLQTRFRIRPALTMSVNLSGIQFLRPDLMNQIEMVLREFGLDPADLKLEITESVIIEHAEHAKMMISQIKAQNIRLSIDDFGTGYSSMSNLRKFPIDTVKIDQSFVGKMKVDEECMEIVRSTVTMAHNLGKDVIAEGVETAEQARLLKGMKCEYGQGYFFSKAVDAESSEDLLSKGWLL